MGSASDTEIDYLSPSFDPASLTVPKIRAILVSHDISYPASAKKPQLIDIFTQELVPRSRRILAARSRTQRTSRGITDMPSSQEGTIDGDDETDRNSMPPPPVPEGSKRRSRTSGRETTGGNSAEPPINRRSSVGRRASGKHARPSDTEAEPEPENKRPLVRKTRKSEVTPSVKVEESENGPLRPSVGESAFSHDNPFQSGSSPLMPSESRRTSGGASVDRRKSSSRRRKIEGSGAGLTQAKQDDGIVVPSVKTFELPLARFRKSKVKDEQDDEVENGEEFTLEEQLELVREGTAIGNKDILPARKNKRARKSNSIPKSAPWVVLMTLLSGYAMWWRREKLEVGYCGIGRPSILLENFQIPEWARSLQPDCEPCPQHAICYERMETKCEQDFVLQPHPLSLGGLVPLPPSCEPDGEKVRRVKVVADKAIEELRERKANWECGTLVDNQGKSAPSVEVDETLLKEQVGKKRRRGMTDAEFEDLWKGALGEIIGREEIVHSVDGYDLCFPCLPPLASTSPVLQYSLVPSPIPPCSSQLPASEQKPVKNLTQYRALTRFLAPSTEATPASSSPVLHSIASPSAAPFDDPSASRWRAIESSLLL